MNAAIEAFRSAIRAAGLNPPDAIIDDGKLRRFAGNGNPRDDADWYLLHGDGIPAGAFGSWRTGQWETWRADIGRQLTPAEEAAQRERIRSAQQAREAEEARRHKRAAATARAIWKAATPAGQDHPYLERKGVAPVATLREIGAEEAARILGYTPQAKGEPLAGRLIVAPVKIGDALSTCELIDEAGRKSAIYGGAKRAGYWSAQPLPKGDGAGSVLLIGEGVVTALSAGVASGHPAIAALSCGNLAAVGRAMRDRYPAAAIVILADIGNGEAAAKEAARECRGLVARPDFGADRPDGATDFNDLAAHRGPDAVARGIEAAIGELINSGVTGVTGVQPNTNKLLAETPDGLHGVTGVTDHAQSPFPDPSERPVFRVFDDWLDHGGERFRPGVWFFGTDKDGNPSNTWVCSPLHVEAVTFDGQDNNFGRLLRFKNSLGRWREWAMPMELLRGAGDDLRGELLGMGVEIDPTPKARSLLGTYLQAKPPKRRMRCALQVGWCDDSFVLPDTVIGAKASGVTFQSGERGHDEYTKAGTLAGWQGEIAARAVGNPLLALALSASFAGPLLGRCNAEGGGVHFVGDSSTGKTTAIEAACSTWGGPNYRRSWRATANGMEGAAAMFNDCLLALDEISECDPREVGAIVYALGNGRGKQRAGRTGSARAITRWRCVVLSSGERTIKTAMEEGGYRAKAGQSVRLLDIPAARPFGTWDTLHGTASGAAFSDAIKRAAITQHGHAGREFLERLTRDERDFCSLLERFKALAEFSTEGGEGQDKRAAGRFALLALAGEAATEYGITGWPEGEATRAAAECFKVWRSARGRGNDERRQILESVSGFLERHGDGRFSKADLDDDSGLRDRAGWWRDADGVRTYLFTSAGMKEAVKGFDFKRALDALVESGALPPPKADGKRSGPVRIGGRSMRLYAINPDKLGTDHGA